MKKIAPYIIRILDILAIPLTLVSALWMKFLRIAQKHLPISVRILDNVGVFPILDQYYEPLFNPKHLYKSLNEERVLPGIDMNEKEQLAILSSFTYQKELLKIPVTSRKHEFHYNNGNFEAGDAEYLYSLIRKVKPKNIIEIGSGYSTLMAVKAVHQNSREDRKYTCKHICIEPYEMPWLEKEKSIEVIRKRVEDMDLKMFQNLGKDDILFIDSSHIIRPQGDVLHEYLEILPALNKGVYVHIHDIFLPRDYPPEWIVKKRRFWNEQYLLEAFLSNNSCYKIIGATNWLLHKHKDIVYEKFPILARQQKRGTGSFWMQKTVSP